MVSLHFICLGQIKAKTDHLHITKLYGPGSKCLLFMYLLYFYGTVHIVKSCGKKKTALAKRLVFIIFQFSLGLYDIVVLLVVIPYFVIFSLTKKILFQSTFFILILLLHCFFNLISLRNNVQNSINDQKQGFVSESVANVHFVSYSCDQIHPLLLSTQLLASRNTLAILHMSSTRPAPEDYLVPGGYISSSSTSYLVQSILGKDFWQSY